MHIHIVLPGKPWGERGGRSPISAENCFALKAAMVNKFCQDTDKFKNLEREGGKDVIMKIILLKQCNTDHCLL